MASRVIARRLIAVLGLAVISIAMGTSSSWAHDAPDTCQGKAITEISLQATSGDDFIFAYELANDVVALGEGNDSANLTGGDDYLCGNEGDDVGLMAGSGADVVNSGDGADMIDGSSGRDWLHGGAGHDEILGGTYEDEIYGDKGEDVLGGEGGDDLIYGNEEDDELFDGYAHDTVHGNAETNHDILYRCDTNNDVYGVELKLGPDTFYC